MTTKVYSTSKPHESLKYFYFRYRVFLIKKSWIIPLSESQIQFGKSSKLGGIAKVKYEQYYENKKYTKIRKLNDYIIDFHLETLFILIRLN